MFSTWYWHVLDFPEGFAQEGEGQRSISGKSGRVLVEILGHEHDPRHSDVLLGGHHLFLLCLSEGGGPKSGMHMLQGLSWVPVQM